MKIWRKKQLEKHKDERGVIINFTPESYERFSEGMYITGKKGSIRAGHFHDEDTHYCFVLEGKILYEWNNKYVEDKRRTIAIANPDTKTNFILLNPGDLVLSDKKELHRFKFLTNGAFIALSTKERTREDYETDTHREEF